MTIGIKGFQKEVACTIAGKAPGLVERPLQIWRTEFCLCRGGSHKPCLAFSFSLYFTLQVLLALASDEENANDLLPGEVAYISSLSLYTYVFENPLCHDHWPGVPRAAADNSRNATKLLAHLEGWSMIIKSRQLWSENCDDQDVCLELLLPMMSTVLVLFCIFVLTCSGSDSENISWHNNWRGQAWSGAKHEGWYLIFLGKLVMALFIWLWTMLNNNKSTRSGCEREGNKAHRLLANTKRKRRPVAQSQPDNIWKWRDAGTTHIVL